MSIGITDPAQRKVELSDIFYKVSILWFYVSLIGVLDDIYTVMHDTLRQDKSLRDL